MHSLKNTYPDNPHHNGVSYSPIELQARCCDYLKNSALCKKRKSDKAQKRTGQIHYITWYTPTMGPTPTGLSADFRKGKIICRR